MASNPFITSAGPVQQQMTVDPEALDIQRQRQYASALFNQIGQMPQGQNVGGVYVPPSWTQNLQAAVTPLVGAYMMNKADTRAQDYAKALRKETAADVGRYLSAIQGTPEEVTYSAEDVGPTRTVTPEVAPDYNKALAIALGSRSPTVQALGANTIAEMTKLRELPAEASLVRVGPSGQITTVGSGAPKTTPDIKNYQFDVSQGYKGTFNQWTQEQNRSKAPSVSVNTEKSYGSAFGQGLAANDVKLYESATKAPQMLETVKETKALLDNDKLYVGFGANQRLDLARAADAFGITGKDTAEKIRNTQRLFANRAQATLDSVRDSGLGAGNGFTDSDRQFLEKAKIGNIVYSKDTIRDQLDIEERVARGLAQKWNNRFSQIPESAKGPTGVGKVELSKSIVETLSGPDREAYDWAMQNKNDPRSKQILKRLGIQ